MVTDERNRTSFRSVLDDSVLDALGRFRGTSKPEFVDRVITMYMETALILLAELKKGSANGDLATLHHASHALKSCSDYRGRLACRPLRRIGGDSSDGLRARCACARGRYRPRISVGGSRSHQPLSSTENGSEPIVQENG